MRSAIDRLRDARQHAVLAQRHSSGLSADELGSAEQPRLAALYCLTVIGTALAAVPGDIRMLSPELPWRAIIGMRNMAVHAYWQLDLEIVADVLNTRLDHLVGGLDQLIGVLETPAP